MSLLPSRSLEERFLRKYGGLKWLDEENEYCLFTARKDMMYFEKRRGNNQYLLFGVRDGFDYDLDPKKQEELWDPWWRDDGLYAKIADYYRTNRKKGVEVFEKGDDCESEED